MTMITTNPVSNATRQPKAAIIAIAVTLKLSALVVFAMDVVVVFVVVVLNAAALSKSVFATK